VGEWGKAGALSDARGKRESGGSRELHINLKEGDDSDCNTI
jgi:hypothetical protein